ncbi:SDR family oxidoreductase [Zymobacter sp. IVIA_5232.4 C2]|uniref:SDR family oxidoreductase n=1 Tax=Zymobacter sp. IVIA_5232.4 C2 TaxID=3394855 RepID=UPI0039C2FCC2
MTQGIEGKVVVITGASSGLGAETARHLVRQGARVVLGARRLDRLHALADTLGLPHEAAFQMDVTDQAQVQALIDHALKLYGRIDVLLNNAGLMPLSPLSMNRYEEWDACIDVNLKGVLYGIGAVLPHMQAQRGGHLIFVSSVAGHVASAGGAVYSATKFGIRAMAESVRKEVKPYGIRTTVLSPGAVETELPASVKAEGVAETIAQYYKDHAITADSFARCVSFAMSQPEDVDINEILFRPTVQEL